MEYIKVVLQHLVERVDDCENAANATHKIRLLERAELACDGLKAAIREEIKATK